METNKITFMIGSGASIPAGMPKTAEITEGICNAHVTEFIGDVITVPPNNYNAAICNYAKKELIEFYRPYGVDMGINYEDIYHVFDQVHNDELDEYPMPLLAQAFKEKYMVCFTHIIEQQFPNDLTLGRNIEIAGSGKALVASMDSELGWLSLADESTLFQQLLRHIEDELIEALAKNAPDVSSLNAFWSAAAEDCNQCHIFTLNHDLVFETLFQREGIPYNNGLILNPEDNLKYWNRKSFDNDNCKIHLYKLHGSVDWWHHHKGVVNNSRIGGLRALLIGTYMKMLEYAGLKVFLDLYHLFYRRLFEEDTTVLIVIGYGFRDRGINNMIINWIYDNDTNKMIIIDPGIDDMKRSGASPAVRRLWERPEVAQRIFEINCGIENVSWNCVKDKILGK
jgi:hypothetical protein